MNVRHKVVDSLTLVYLFKINKKVIEKINKLKKIRKELNEIKIAGEWHEVSWNLGLIQAFID